MRRSELKKLKAIAEEVEREEKENGKSVKGNPHKAAEILVRQLYGSKSPGGVKFAETVGNDEEFTFKRNNDLRPVVFSWLSNEDGRLYHCSAILTDSQEVLEKRLKMNPFPVEPEVWQEMIKGDVLDAMILTTFDIEGKGYDFRTQYVGLHKVNLLIRNVLNMDVPPGYEEDEE
ncbi:MAG: hypothetical protein IJT01_13810 [Selenomonadaceae bacterium]|nr:hypothetical protein [Selenomonadaceae bacterium]